MKLLRAAQIDDALVEVPSLRREDWYGEDGDKAFVDTNILLRAMIPRMNQHAKAEDLIQKMLEENVELRISCRMIREYV